MQFLEPPEPKKGRCGRTTPAFRSCFVIGGELFTYQRNAVNAIYADLLGLPEMVPVNGAPSLRPHQN